MENLRAYLAEHAFLQGLKSEHLDLLVGCAENVRFDPGEFVFREGKTAERFYMVRHGNISLEIFKPGHGPIAIETIGEGELLGWSWLVPPYLWNFDARCLDLTRALALDGACLRQKCEDDHDLGYEIVKRFSSIISQRLQATRLQLLDIYGNGGKR